MKKLLVFIFALFCSKIAMADVGVPLLMVLKPVAILTLIPVILIEYFYFVKRVGKLPTLSNDISKANILSMFVGIPLAVLPALTPIFPPILICYGPFFIWIYEFYRLMKRKWKRRDSVTLIFSVVLVIILFTRPEMANELDIKFIDDYFWWGESKKFTFITWIPVLIVDCLVSWWIEYKILKKTLTEINPKDLKRFVLEANIYSYIFLFVILILLYLDRM